MTSNQDSANSGDLQYAELHCLSNYSFLRGASHPEELIATAKSLKYHAIAITDECSMAGAVKAHVAAKTHQIKLLIGSEFHLLDGMKLILLAKNRSGYGTICHLISIGRRRADKGEYELRLNDVPSIDDGVTVIWLPDIHDLDNQWAMAKQLHSHFGRHLYIGSELGVDGLDHIRETLLNGFMSVYQWPIVACGNIYMHHRSRKPLLDVLHAIRMGIPLSLAGRHLHQNGERHLKPVHALAQSIPKPWITATTQLADECRFSLDELRYEYPQELVPSNETPSSYLAALTWAGAKKRWPKGIPRDIDEQIQKELDLIAELAYEYYFLTVFDIVRFAKDQGILCQGRGSAANSAVCYCLEITEVDPTQVSLLFERFISKERNEPPDIDVDFEHQRREEVIQYLYKKYSRERAALAATVITYRPKSAIRDVGKALGIDSLVVEQLAKNMAWWEKKDSLIERFEEAGVSTRNNLIHRYIELVHQLLGFPRHLSQHVGGFVISQGPLSELAPIENAAMPERTIIQWDKDDLEALGLLKVDILALGMLTAIRKAIDLVNLIREETLSIADIPREDAATYHMLQQGDSVGVFQVESRAQMAMLPRLKPQSYYDLVVQVAIVRPGPIQGKMVHPYLKRRQGTEAVTYASEAVKGVLERTLGVPIFQEQVIKLAVVAAGFTPGEADQLRRAMAAWKRKGGLDHFGEKLIQGMLSNGHDLSFAERVFEQIKGFGEYGFPESHAASFALLVYLSAWLKRHEPAAFYCGLLNSLPMGFYSASQLIQDAKRHGINVLPVNVLTSHWESSLEFVAKEHTKTAELNALTRPQPAVRLGMCRIKGFNALAAERIIAARRQHMIDSLHQLKRLAQLNDGELDVLIASNACEPLSGHRHQSHWTALGIGKETPLIRREPDDPSTFLIKAPSEKDNIGADYQSLGLTLRRHPMRVLRETSNAFDQCLRATDLTTLRHGRLVQVAGLVTGRQRPSTASGIIFMTLEDETQNINVVIQHHIQDRFRKTVLRGQLVRVKGILEKENGVIHVVAGHFTDLSDLLSGFTVKSRDFH